MKLKRWSFMIVVFGLICLMALSGCDDDDDDGADADGAPANPAFNGTFSGNFFTTQGGTTSTETVIMTATVGPPAAGSPLGVTVISVEDEATMFFAAEVTGDTATFTTTTTFFPHRGCDASVEGTMTLLDNDRLSVEMSGSDCNGPFTSTAILNRGITGNGPGFEAPSSIAVEADGHLVVVDVSLKAVVRVDPVSGDRTILSDAATGSGPGFKDLRGIAVEADGSLVVTDADLDAVVRVDPVSGDRTILSDAATGSRPVLVALHDIAVEADGSLVVADFRLKAVIRVDPVSGDRTILADAATGSGLDIKAVSGIAVEADGGLVVANIRQKAVVRVDPVSGDRTILSDATFSIFP
jgi:hypothetical protein